MENLEGRGPGEGVPALDRIVFFSDAVFAIAITLLAIDVRLPDLPANQTNDTLILALQGIAPKIYAFVLSFGVIALASDSLTIALPVTELNAELKCSPSASFCGASSLPG